MRQFQPPLKLFSWLTASILGFLIIGCHKSDQTGLADEKSNLSAVELNASEKFLSLPVTVPTSIKKIAEYIRIKNQQKGFLDKFIQKEGFAIWDKAFIRQIQSKQRNGESQIGTEEMEVLIPLVFRDSSSVHAALACKIKNDSVYINLLDGRTYKSHNADSARTGINGRKLSLILMLLNKEVFGHTIFRIKDSAAFGGLGKSVKYVKLTNRNGNVSGRMVLYTVEICYSILVPPNEGWVVGCPPDGPCNQYTEQYNCDYFTGWYDDGISGGGGIGGGGDSGGSSSGGSGDGWTNPPVPCDTNPQGRIGPCDEDNIGWDPIDYILTLEEIRIWNEVEHDFVLGDTQLGKDCQGTNRTGNAAWRGTIEHWVIQVDFIMRNLGTGEVEYQIPTGNGKSYADMVNTFSREIFEIKPDNAIGLSQGQAEITNYVANANLYCAASSTIPWKPGNNYDFRRIPNPKEPTQYLEVFLASPGVILYRNVPRINVPPPLVVPVTIFDKINSLIERLKRYPDYQTVISQFCNENPDVVTFIKGATVTVGVAIMVATILEDIISGGAGIADDWVSFKLAKVIIDYAMKLP
jgi:hypothetical protein